MFPKRFCTAPLNFFLPLSPPFSWGTGWPVPSGHQNASGCCSWLHQWCPLNACRVCEARNQLNSTAKCKATWNQSHLLVRRCHTNSQRQSLLTQLTEQPFCSAGLHCDRSGPSGRAPGGQSPEDAADPIKSQRKHCKPLLSLCSKAHTVTPTRAPLFVCSSCRREVGRRRNNSGLHVLAAYS